MPKPKKKLKPKLPPARSVLTLLAGVLSFVDPFYRGRCRACNVKKDQKHHPDCVYYEAVRTIIRYY